MDDQEATTSYQVLRIRINDSSTFRHLYIKPTVVGETLVETSKHPSKAPRTNEKAMFVTGLPAQLNELSLLELFETFGEIVRVAVHPQRTSAVVLFASKKGLAAALKSASRGRTIDVQVEAPKGPHGLKAWVESHKSKKPGNNVLQKQLDAWIEAWEEEEERKKAEALASLQEDGWTVVQRHRGRKKNTEAASGTVVGGVAAAAAAAHAAKKKPKLSLDFYRFQQRDRRRNELLELRQKFEEDKKRLAELKAARKFRPLG